MLSVRTRQIYLQALGFYRGEVDGIEGPMTRAAYARLQNRYFIRARDKDGRYGINTERLLISAYNCRDLRYFKLEEFRCRCNGKYCTGYPAALSREMLLKLENNLRPRYGAITVISGLRCYEQNAIVGGVANSRHKLGKATDFQCAESRRGASTRTAIINFCKTIFRYSYGNTRGMGASIHVDVR